MAARYQQQQVGKRQSGVGQTRRQGVPLKMLPFDNKNEFQILVDMPETTTLETTDAAVRECQAQADALLAHTRQWLKSHRPGLLTENS